MTIQSAPTNQQSQHAKDQATFAYQNRVSEYSEDFSATPDARGNLPRKFFHGALQSTTYAHADAMVRDLADKLTQGYTLSDVTTQSIGMQQVLLLTKPESVQAAELKIVHAEAEAHLKARFAAEAEKAIALEVEVAIATQIEEERVAVANAAAAQRARIEKDIRAARGMR